LLGNRIRRVDPAAAVIAGLAAGATYVATMEVDNRITGVNEDDLKILGRPFVEDSNRAKLIGVPIHFGNSIALAMIYGAIARDRLPGPPWFRGAVFATVENTVLYPLAMLEQHHPAVRNGEVDRYWTWRAYLQSIPRHVTYGAVLGLLYERLHGRKTWFNRR
jgi:hypothetical protein